jgi:hypothetical protein
LVTISGTVSFDATLRIRKQAIDTAKEREVSKILVNTFAVNGELSTLQRYDLATGVLAHAKQREIHPILAMVGKAPTVDGIAVRVGQNRTLNAEAFSDQQEALNWLSRWPNGSTNRPSPAEKCHRDAGLFAIANRHKVYDLSEV